MHDVFISYSTREREQACAIRSFLTGKGIFCWMAPESIPTGSNYTKEIPVAIRNCQVFLLILSENAQKSPWVLRELDGAVNNHKYILPYLLDDRPMEDEFQFLLTGCQWHPSWQENALESLAERIHSLLPPKEAPAVPEVPAPVIPPEPEKPAAPPTAPAAPVQPTVFCPACHSGKLDVQKNGKLSYDRKESARFLLAWLAGIAAFMPLMYVIRLFLQYVPFLVTYRSAYSVQFTVPGQWILVILTIAASVGVGILCRRTIRKRIRQLRMQNRVRAVGIRCRDCCKKFRVTIPAGTRFPWEKPLPPVVPVSNVAEVRCPACGTPEITPQKNSRRSYSRKEFLRFLPAWLVGLVCYYPLCYLASIPLRYVDIFVNYRGTYLVEYSELGLFVIAIVALAAALGVVRLAKLPIQEWIRRSRVREHIRACSFRCPDCGVDFRVVIPLSHKFSCELSRSATDAAEGRVRSGKNP